jgi:hypothetical protein
MRENPLPNSDKTFKGDNFGRTTGDTQKLIEVDSFINQANTINKDLGVRILIKF